MNKKERTEWFQRERERERERERVGGMVDSLLQVMVFVNAEKNFHCPFCSCFAFPFL